MPNDLGFEIPDANALKVVYSKTDDIPPLLGLNFWLSWWAPNHVEWVGGNVDGAAPMARN